MQAGNSIGGAISADGRLVVAQNYQPGGIKVFDAATLELLADVPASMPGGERSRVVGLADLPQHRFIYSLFDAEAICIADCGLMNRACKIVCAMWAFCCSGPNVFHTGLFIRFVCSA